MATGSSLYESPGIVAEYLLFHYGDVSDVLGDFPGPSEAVGFATRLVRQLLDPRRPMESALDIGCAVGASSFELSRSFDRVVGIDYSQAFIDAARQLQSEGEIPTKKRIEGQIFGPFTAKVDPTLDRLKVRFEVGDACNLSQKLGAFDAVVAANLICRLPDPRIFLGRLPSLVKPGGQLLLTTPFTWMEEYTPVRNWLGATPQTGSSFEVLKAALEPDFILEHEEDLPFLIREHSRKFQFTFAKGTRWRRKTSA